MRMITLVLVACLLVEMAQGSVMITEVLYDPITTDTGGEFVELFNSGEEIVDVGGWAIATKSSAADTTIPQGTVIRPKAYYLIADSGWGEKKDNPEWPAADIEDAITLSNTDAGAALKRNGTIIDAVGWGTAGEGLYEGNATGTVEQGYSLARKKLNGSYVDSGNNFNDFFSSMPEPQNSNVSEWGNNKLELEVRVAAHRIYFSSINITDDDPSTPGIQISPIPGAEKKVKINASVASGSGDIEANITFLNQSMPLEGNKGEISLDYFYKAGEYNLTLSASDGYASNRTIIAFTYLPMVAMIVDAPSLSVDDVFPGEEIIIEGDNSTSTIDKPTLKNIGNTELGIVIKATPLLSESSAISLQNLFCSVNGSFVPITEGSLKNINLGLNKVQPLSFKLAIPNNTSAGTYKSSININAIGS